jgi:maltodextrin utilization protein YvdJ
MLFQLSIIFIALTVLIVKSLQFKFSISAKFSLFKFVNVSMKQVGNHFFQKKKKKEDC